MKEIRVILEWDQGSKKIHNVPVLVDKSGEQYFNSSINVKVSIIAERMKENNLNEYDFNSFI